MKKLTALIFLLAFSFTMFAQEIARDQSVVGTEGYVPTPFKTSSVIKWEETFDTTTQPADWQVIDNDGSGTFMSFVQQLNFTGGDVNPQAGQSFWFSSWQNSAASGLIDEWLISPQLPEIESGDSLYFYAGAIGGSYDDSLKVYVSTTDANPASFTEIAYFKVEGPIGAWYLYGFDLSAFAGSPIYVAVNYYIVDGGPSGTHSDNVWIDHFILTGSDAAVTYPILDHNTGSMQLSVFDNGLIGHNGAFNQGNGVVYLNQPDAMYTAGIMIGTDATGVNGMVGSFTSGGNPVINDMVNTMGMEAMYSTSLFDQITDCKFKDDNATAPLGLEVHQQTLARTGDDFVIYNYMVYNNTGATVSDVYVGQFADWDVDPYATNLGGVDASRSMAYQYGNGSSDPNYYGLVALSGASGAAVAANFTWTVDDLRFVLLDFMKTLNTAPIATGADYRSYIGSGPYTIPDGGMVQVGFAVVAGTDMGNLEANADIAINTWADGNLPVELTSFTAVQNGLNVELNWSTATEINNLGFEIERKVDEGQWRVVGFKEGKGTTAEPVNYAHVDDISAVQGNSIYYRLKQIDFGGAFEYSDEILVENLTPVVYSLDQNYPNPFNPATTIKFGIPEDNFVSLKVFNVLGEEVATLINEIKSAGTYNVEFNASSLPSGMYLYVLRTGENNASSEFTSVKKMMLLK